MEISAGDLAELKKGILFRNMSEEDIRVLMDIMKPERRIYEKNTVVVRDGDFITEMSILISGELRLFHIDSNGNSNLLEILQPGDSLGMLNAVGQYRLHLSAVTMKKTEIFLLNVNPLLRSNVLTASVQIRFLQNLTLALAQKAHRLSVKLEESVRRSTRDRIQDYLSAQYHKAGSRIFSIPLNRQDLADYLFVDRSAMSNELCKMREEGLIKFEKSRFELLIEMPITEEEIDPNEEK